MLNKYIYSDVGTEILFCINKALLACIEIGVDSDLLTPENSELIQCFDSLKNSAFDLHITEGLFESHQKRGEKVYPRILKLTINAFKDASDVKVKSRFVIPSPINILYYTLIVPEHSQTAAYSLASCRTLLFNLLEKVYYSNNKKDEKKQFIGLIDEESISQSVDSLTRNIKIGRSWPKDINLKSINSFINLIVGHFLAMKGITHLSFNDQTDAKNFLSVNTRDQFLDEFPLHLMNTRFRISNKYEDLPDTGELINQLYGIPLPIKGAEVVFFGGLKPSSKGGLIIGVSGQAGIGKTSFALAFANSLSPLGIKCFYISLEEDENDIRKRLFSLQTPFDKELSYYRKPYEWFSTVKSSQTLTLNDLIELCEKIKEKMESGGEENNSQHHSVIVIDNLNEFYDEKDYGKIEKVIEKFRELKSIVILIGGEGVLEKLRMEYLIDNGISLIHEGLNKKGEKPLRLFNLYKTRHQLSRQGTHVFHMSGDEGFRISPQIPSQMDRKEKLKRYLHDETKITHTLNYLSENEKTAKILYRKNKSLIIGTKDSLQKDLDNSGKSGSKIEPFFKLFPRTHILIHGYGSAGKAGFALKLLLTPPVKSEIQFPIVSDLTNDFSNVKYRRRVLIISFLYPQKYYHELVYEKGIDLQSKISKTYDKLQQPILDYLIFYPGYISPEDFINKITRKIDQAILEGQPFNGVLIDGLHNVFLQFIRLQDNDMVWPLLYNILARYDLTVVSTFTNFSMNDRLLDDDPNSKNKILNQALPDHMLLQKGMAPFLHALVKASDFYFFLEQLVLKSGERKYLMSIKGAIGQDVPTELLEWNRQKNVFTAIHTYKEILQMMRYDAE
jgi:KaiC/GvpD/RAD55 family RecA-like ATPase